MTRNQLRLALVPFFGSAVACSNPGPVDLGHNVGGALSDYAASWDGYTEAFHFDPNSDRLRITLDANGQGTVVVGDQPAPAPLVIDEANYVGVPPPTLVPGLLYQVQGARVEAGRIQLGISANEPYRQWCTMQTPICYGAGDHCGCSYGTSVTCSAPGTCLEDNPETGGTHMLTAAQISLCSVFSVCSCTASGCSVGADTQFDAALENGGADLVGTLVVEERNPVGQLQVDRITVRLTRQ
jgi:hypothetical protein